MPLRPVSGAAKLAASFFFVLLSACSTLTLKPEQAGRLPSLRSHSISNVPFFSQLEDQCGPASLATMLGARNINVTPEALRDKVYIPAKQGALTTEMSARARQYGLVVYPLEPELPAVLNEVSRDNPVLVLQNLGFDWLPKWHFSVVIGYDLQQQTITLRSGNEPSHTIAFSLFQKTWQRADHWAVVMTAPQQIPVTAQASVFLNAANELETVGETWAALAAYRAASKRWPGNTTAYFGAGNMSYRLGQYAEARDLFSKYVELKPGAAAGWNNLAYSLLKLGCAKEAKRAVACALQLEPNNITISESFSEISAPSLSVDSSGSCDFPQCPL